MISAQLYTLGDDLSGSGIDLTELTERTFQPMVEDPGTGSFTMVDTDAQFSDLSLDGNDLVAFDIDGTRRFTMVVEKLKRIAKDRDEARAQQSQFSGRGHLALLSRSVVYPALGVDRHPVEEDRQFNWTSPVFDDSAWDPSVKITTVGDAKAGGGAEWPIPWADDMPDDTAEILWAPYFLPNYALTGDVYFHQRFTAAHTGRHLIFATADNYAEIYIDGALIVTVSGNNGFGFTHATQMDVDLDAGEHLVAVVGSNLPLAGTGVNPAGIAWAIYVPGYPPTLVAHSDHVDCTLVGYPTEPPGMTPGEVLRLVVEEAQARGELAYLTLGFDDVNDYNGDPWPVVADIATKVGNDLLTFVFEIADTYVDLEMPPDSYELRAYNKDARGTASGVVFEDGVNITHREHDLELAGRMNKALERWGGGWSEDVTGDGDYPATLGLGALSSRAEVQRVAVGQLAIFADPREQITAQTVPTAGAVPFVDFTVGDTVTVPLVDGTPSEERVMAIGVSETDTGKVVYTPTLKDVILNAQDRFARAMKKMTNGTLGGSSRVAQPVVPTYVPRGLVLGGGSVTSPEFEFVASGTDSGSGTRTLGSVTIGGEDDGTYYVLAVEFARSSNMANLANVPTHGGASAVSTFISPGTGQAVGRAVYIVTPGVTPTLDSFHFDPNNTGTIGYAWSLVKVIRGGTPTGGSSAGGGIGNTTYVLNTVDDHADEGCGLLVFMFSFAGNVANAYTQTLTWTGDLAPNAQSPVANPIGSAHLDVAFYPASGEGPRTDLEYAGSVSTSTSTIKASIPVPLKIPGL